MATQIRIEGLAEFNRNLRKMDKGLPKALRLAMNDAADVVIDYAKPRVPMRTGKARRSIKARSTTKLVRVSGGGKRASYFPWLEFGGRVGRKNSVHRTRRKHGRYLYQGYYATRDDFEHILRKSLRRVAMSAGLSVN